MTWHYIILLTPTALVVLISFFLLFHPNLFVCVTFVLLLCMSRSSQVMILVFLANKESVFLPVCYQWTRLVRATCDSRMSWPSSSCRLERTDVNLHQFTGISVCERSYSSSLMLLDSIQVTPLFFSRNNLSTLSWTLHGMIVLMVKQLLGMLMTWTYYSIKYVLLDKVFSEWHFMFSLQYRCPLLMPYRCHLSCLISVNLSLFMSRQSKFLI